MGNFKMQIKKILNIKFLFFLFLALTLGLLVGLRLMQKEKPLPILPSPIPSPKIKASPIPSPEPAKGDPTYFQEMEETNQNYYPLLKYLPHETTLFKVRYADPMVLEITLKGPDQDQAKQDALNWLTEIGADLEKHQLKFLTP